MPTPPSAEPLLEAHGLVKVFPGVRALDGVDLVVRPGEVHCLLGQNGAGKSTLIKVLAGVHAPDGGELRWRGAPLTVTDPLSAIATGIATIYQELDLVDGLTVAENVFLGHEPARWGFGRRAVSNAATAEILRRLGHPEIGPAREVGELPAAAKQIVSMARALSHDAKLIIMDEPSAVLDPEEVDGLFRVVTDLRAEGTAIVYISHRLEEIRRIGDRITVLKDGRTAATDLPVATTPTAELISLMTGRDIAYVFPPRRKAGTRPAAEPVLTVENLARRGEFSDVGFAVHPGEIVGLAGLVGAGRTEILETVYGARRPDAGTVTVRGRPLRPGSVPAAERVAARSVTRSLDVRPDDPDRVVRTLSGGNQQKVVLARWLLRECAVLLLDEPSRGVDVGARSEIYALIRELADSGVAILLVSSEIEEVLGLADRVLVVADGTVVHDGPAQDVDEHRVLDLIMEGGAA